MDLHSNHYFPQISLPEEACQFDSFCLQNFDGFRDDLTEIEIKYILRL